MSGTKKLISALMAVALPVLATAGTTERLHSATANGNVAFVLVTQPGATGVDQARQKIREAMTKVSGSVMIESDRSDAANASFVQKYKLATAPVPLILVFAANGVLAGGNLANRLTSPQLVSFVPSPKKAEVLAALQEGKAVYLTAYRSGMGLKNDVAKCCATAADKMKSKCARVEVNVDDPAESLFLRQLKINMNSTEPVTMVINSRGQVTGVFTGAVDVDKLIASAKKVVKSSCCAPGSGKSCGTTAKKGGK